MNWKPQIAVDNTHGNQAIGEAKDLIEQANQADQAYASTLLSKARGELMALLASDLHKEDRDEVLDHIIAVSLANDDQGYTAFYLAPEQRYESPYITSQNESAQAAEKYVERIRELCPRISDEQAHSLLEKIQQIQYDRITAYAALEAN